MKKLFCLFLATLMVLSLVACGGEKAGKKGVNTTATEEDIAQLENLYAGLEVHHGQLHDHSKSGRNSDGKATLLQWKENMPSVGMEYVALLDHRQTDHMY